MDEPEDALIARLASRAGRGTYEAHVTVAADTDPERFQATCAALGVKCVRIELPAGAAPLQPMTASYHRGELAAVAVEVAGLCRAVRSAGFAVRRLKLEAVATNEGVPETDAEAATAPPSDHFEFHIKLMLPADTDEAALRALVGQHGARLSRNARKQEADGRAERFVTLRVYGKGRGSAFAAFDRLCDDLTAAGYTVSSRLREYIVFDSEAGLDAGWMEGAGER